jgi:pimeloyl-ACP methyl ester carboxylesterase
VEYRWTPAATETLLFLPGASGNTQFWKPVGAHLRHPGARHFLAWPGCGGVPAERDVRGIADLVARVVRQITHPVALLAQSMGGVIAVRAALEKPDLVRHLVLSVTSGGVDVARLGAQDWRPSFRQHHPDAPRWFLDEREDSYCPSPSWSCSRAVRTTSCPNELTRSFRTSTGTWLSEKGDRP